MGYENFNGNLDELLYEFSQGKIIFPSAQVQSINNDQSLTNLMNYKKAPVIL